MQGHFNHQPGVPTIACPLSSVQSSVWKSSRMYGRQRRDDDYDEVKPPMANQTSPIPYWKDQRPASSSYMELGNVRYPPDAPRETPTNNVSSEFQYTGQLQHVKDEVDGGEWENGDESHPYSVEDDEDYLSSDSDRDRRKRRRVSHDEEWRTEDGPGSAKIRRQKVRQLRRRIAMDRVARETAVELNINILRPSWLMKRRDEKCLAQIMTAAKTGALTDFTLRGHQHIDGTIIIADGSHRLEVMRRINAEYDVNPPYTKVSVLLHPGSVERSMFIALEDPARLKHSFVDKVRHMRMFIRTYGVETNERRVTISELLEMAHESLPKEYNYSVAKGAVLNEQLWNAVAALPKEKFQVQLVNMHSKAKAICRIRADHILAQVTPNRCQETLEELRKLSEDMEIYLVSRGYSQPDAVRVLNELAGCGNLLSTVRSKIRSLRADRKIPDPDEFVKKVRLHYAVKEPGLVVHSKIESTEASIFIVDGEDDSAPPYSELFKDLQKSPDRVLLVLNITTEYLFHHGIPPNLAIPVEMLLSKKVAQRSSRTKSNKLLSSLVPSYMFIALRGKALTEQQLKAENESDTLERLLTVKDLSSVFRNKRIFLGSETEECLDVAKQFVKIKWLVDYDSSKTPRAAGALNDSG